MRRCLLPVLVALAACSAPGQGAGFEARAAVLREMLAYATLDAPPVPYEAACIAVDRAFAADGVNRPTAAFVRALDGEGVTARRIGRCAENPGTEGFRWNATEAGRREVLLVVEHMDSLTDARAVVGGMWLAEGAAGASYRCVAVRPNDRGSAHWHVLSCTKTYDY